MPAGRERLLNIHLETMPADLANTPGRDLKHDSSGCDRCQLWGLYDMHGNVWEWVEDDWHVNYNEAPTDGRAWVESPRGIYRVIRGGGWNYDALDCRSAARFSIRPGFLSNDVGFRLARFSVALGP